MAKNRYERKIVPSRADEREARTGMRQSKGAMIAKIVLGGLFLAVSLDTSDGNWTIGYFLFCLILGGGLIAWGLLPYLEARRRHKEAEEAKKAARDAKILSVPLEKFSDGNAGMAESLAGKYDPSFAEERAAEPVLGIDWNKDGKLDWKDAVVDQAVIREGKEKVFGEEGQKV
ncbi:MAG: hypothetical protein IKH87_10145 [Firmicutes bacterium]|nr:hypothetical protein [Bacillota bacterium]MBR4142510.1 hypothetical protein [Bacillota bacterium]MBR6971066.1 hypothetical protein [Bacillota bacterium]